MKSFLHSLKTQVLSSDTAMRAIHSFIAGFLVVFLAGVPLISHQLHAHAFGDAKKALISLVLASCMAGYAACRKFVWAALLTLITKLGSRG